MINQTKNTKKYIPYYLSELSLNDDVTDFLTFEILDLKKDKRIPFTFDINNLFIVNNYDIVIADILPVWVDRYDFHGRQTFIDYEPDLENSVLVCCKHHLSHLL